MPFGQFSLIYGWNGSGKTSISSLLRNCQDGVAPESDVELLVDGKAVKGSNFPGAALPLIRVFNKDFVDCTVFEDPNKQLPIVYVVSDDGKAKNTQLAISCLSPSNQLLRCLRVSSGTVERRIDALPDGLDRGAQQTFSGPRGLTATSLKQSSKLNTKRLFR